MDLKTAERFHEEYAEQYEEKNAENSINQEKFFLNSLEIVHLPPFDDTSYDVILYAIKEGKVITFKIQDAIRIFGDSLK
ncbi:MAG: hypothetical protein IPP64_03710 [Bacteroidetes bacterium]|nr:hypothetical protein [Bacteroidota bacterium]